MSFELITQIDEEGNEIELIKETIIKVTPDLVITKLWLFSDLEERIVELIEEEKEKKDRKTLLEDQLKKFKDKDKP